MVRVTDSPIEGCVDKLCLQDLKEGNRGLHFMLLTLSCTHHNCLLIRAAIIPLSSLLITPFLLHCCTSHPDMMHLEHLIGVIETHCYMF